MTTIGWQWHCAHAEQGCDDPDPAFFDTWQNPDQGKAILAAARAHANRTGHVAWVERHQRLQVPPSAKGGGAP